MKKEVLIIFAKNPELGKVKTRLAATIGDINALEVYQQLLTHTAFVTKEVQADKFVFYSNFLEMNDLWENDQYYKEVQHGFDLGERMKNALSLVLQKGYGKGVIIGTDCPDLDTKTISNAIDNLDQHDVVIGPAKDGGYYLIGMKHLYPAMFKNINWSTETVFEETIQKCNELGLSYHLLPVLIDVDEEKDLKEMPWLSQMKKEVLTDVSDEHR